jgi:hypothetical protein
VAGGTDSGGVGSGSGGSGAGGSGGPASATMVNFSIDRFGMQFGAGATSDPAARQCSIDFKVRRCKFKRVTRLVETRVESAWCQLLKPKYDKLLSSFAFKFNLRQYIKDHPVAFKTYKKYIAGRCRLIPVFACTE